MFRAVGGMRRVQISCDICTRFARCLYSTKCSWITILNIGPHFIRHLIYFTLRFARLQHDTKLNLKDLDGAYN